MNESVFAVPLDRIRPNPFQPKVRLEKIVTRREKLAGLIQEQGLMHYPNGRVVHDGCVVQSLLNSDYGTYLQQFPAAYVELSIGHTRFGTFEYLHELTGDDRWATIPVVLRPFTDAQMARNLRAENTARNEQSIVEDIQLFEQCMTEFGWSHTEVGTQFGIARTTVANKLRLRSLPDEVLEAVDNGQLSERAAAAFLPIFALPEPARKKVDKGGHDCVPTRKLIERALDKSLDSQRLRSEVRWTISKATRGFGAGFPTNQDLNIKGVRSATCQDCSFKVVVGKEERCGDPRCFSKKTKANDDAKLNKIAQSIGLPMITGKKVVFRRYSHRELVEQLVKKPCVNFGVCKSNNSWDTLYVPDSDSALIYACDGKLCRCAAQHQQSTEAAVAAQRQLESDRYNKLLWEPTANAIKDWFVSQPAEVCWMAQTLLGYSTDGVMPYEELAAKAANKLFDWDIKNRTDLKKVRKGRKVVDAQLKPMGIEIDWPPTKNVG